MPKPKGSATYNRRFSSNRIQKLFRDNGIDPAIEYINAINDMKDIIRESDKPELMLEHLAKVAAMSLRAMEFLYPRQKAIELSGDVEKEGRVTIFIGDKTSEPGRKFLKEHTQYEIDDETRFAN